MLNNMIFAFLTWQISSGTEHNLTLCNKRYETLACETNFIFIIDVFYGRDNNLICQPGSHSYCSSNKTDNIIRQKCDGKSVCYVSVYPGVLKGRNCIYANPYLRIHYKCKKPKASVTTVHAIPSDGTISKTETNSITVTGSINTTCTDGMTMEGIKGATSETDSISIYFKISMVSCGAVFLILISIAIFLFAPCLKKKPTEMTESKTAAKDLWI